MTGTEELEKGVALIEGAATRAAAGFRSMAPALESIRTKRPELAERLLPALLDLRDAIDSLITLARAERKA